MIPNTAKVIHVFVALCDNKNQGIVPVPKTIGNGQDAASNLYWGCAGGVKGYFKKQPNWKLMSTTKSVSSIILERCVFKHTSYNAYIVADAYDGAAIKACTIDFFNAAAGRNNQSLAVQGTTLGIGGSAQLIAYTGHDGLMDFSLPDYPAKLHDTKRETIILACISKRFFSEGIRQAGATPLIWSTGLMSPEAYTLEASIAGWLAQETPAQIRQRAAAAYDRYQHCGVKAASRLLVTGW
ncbi:hypothetical protein HB364_04415 [Pseudoflavitalea sp. X16]|nr:hypothetical protein [Paraflavitalea devenefica]